MFEEMKKEIDDHMEKALKVLHDEYAQVRTGRATPALLDAIKVDFYGTLTPIPQMASVTTPDPKTLVIQPWDQSTLPNIEKAIQKSELGITPQNDGKIIRLPLPPLTEERRKDLVKVIHKLGEDCRIAIRNIRRHGMDNLKKGKKEDKISEDDVKRGQTEIQNMTDTYVKKVDTLVEKKSTELLTV